MPTSPTEPINVQLPIEALRQDIQGVVEALARQQELLRMRSIALDPVLVPLLRSLNHNLQNGANTLMRDTVSLNQLRVLADVAALVNSSLDLDTVLETAIDAVLTLTGAGRGYLLLLDQGDDLHFHVARTRSGEEDDGADSVSRTLLRQVIASGQPLLTDNAALDPRMAMSGTAARYTLRSVMCAPLILKDAVIGAVYVDNRTRDGVFSQRELQLLTAIANQISVAMDNASLFASAQNSLREIAEATGLVQNVFASVASGVITTDERDAIRGYNSAAADILMVPVEDALGRPLRSVLPMLGGEFEDAFNRAQIERVSSSIEVETEIAERGRVALTLTISPLKAAGDLTEGIVIVIDDQTEKREREQSLELLRRYLPPGMLDSIQSISQLGIEGERREVTCMFVDPGSLARFGSLPAPEMMSRLNRYLEALTVITHGARGIVDKYMGAEAMTLFNTQLNPQEDHARSALLSALLITDQFAALDDEYGLGARGYRIGIHSGVATLGNVGGIQRRSFTAIGDNINLARRLQENAQPGQILLSEETYRHLRGGVGDAVKFIEGTALQVKGRQRPVRVFEVVRA
jgi:class 3 adenylate cyclase/GAF domain-containing protein